MKTLLILTISTLIAGFAHAQFEFPRGTFKFSELDQAKTAAAAGKKDIAFVYTNDKSTCPLCIGASESFVDAVKSKAVIVYLDSTDTKTSGASSPGKFVKALLQETSSPK